MRQTKGLATKAGRDKGAGILLLGELELHRVVQIDALATALETAFIQLSSGTADVPPRIAATAPDGSLLAVMPGYLDGTLAAKLVSIFPQNPARGLPAIQAVVVLFSLETGAPIAIMDGTYLTAVRTAGASAVATKLLAREDANVLTVVGAGTQGQAHLAAVSRVRNFREIRLVSRDRRHAQEVAREVDGVRVMESVEQAVTGADVVCLCTDSSEPVIRLDWLKPGAHVNSVGFAEGPELDTEIVRRGRLFVESRTAFQPYPAGSAELQGMNPELGTELGEALAGTRPGRLDAVEITVYKSMGHAVEDAAAARFAYDSATRAGIGTVAHLSAALP